MDAETANRFAAEVAALADRVVSKRLEPLEKRIAQLEAERNRPIVAKVELPARAHTEARILRDPQTGKMTGIISDQK